MDTNLKSKYNEDMVSLLSVLTSETQTLFSSLSGLSWTELEDYTFVPKSLRYKLGAFGLKDMGIYRTGRVYK